jgi:hypothetical protein
MTISDIVMLKLLVISNLKSKFRPGNNSYLFSLSSIGEPLFHYLSDVYMSEIVSFLLCSRFYLLFQQLTLVVLMTGI